MNKPVLWQVKVKVTRTYEETYTVTAETAFDARWRVVWGNGTRIRQKELSPNKPDIDPRSVHCESLEVYKEAIDEQEKD